MSENIVLKKGLDIPLAGEAELRVSKSIKPGVVAVRPGDFKGLLPRLLVKEGDSVLRGSPVISDKKNPDIILSSPVSGTIKALVRGEKRKLLAVLIKSDGENKCVNFGALKPEDSSVEELKGALLKSGLWPWIVQRPYGVIADPGTSPSAVFVSAFNTAPLAPDPDFCFKGELENIQTGINALSKLSGAEVHVSYDAKSDPNSELRKLSGVSSHLFKGKHPAGNVGVQISHISPIDKGTTVWTISLEGLAAMGRLFRTGELDLTRKVAVCGPKAIEPSYVETIPGMSVKELSQFSGSDLNELRFVSGDALSGSNEGNDGYLGFFSNQITILAEGVEKELFGWIRPMRLKQFSNDRSYFSWLFPKKKYKMNTNLHGGPRPFLMNDGYYAKVLPMDLYPVYLAKACLAGEIEKMEQFGIYEVLPEDLAVCEFIDPSKNNFQEIIAKGIDLMLKEMA